MTYSKKLDAGKGACLVDAMPCVMHGQSCSIKKKPIFDVSGLPCPDMSTAGKRQKRAGPTNAVYIAHGRWTTDSETPLILVECTKEARAVIIQLVSHSEHWLK